MKKLFLSIIALTMVATGLQAANISYYYQKSGYTRQKQMADTIFYAYLNSAQKLQFNAGQSVTLSPQQAQNLGTEGITQITKFPPNVTNTSPQVGGRGSISSSSISKTASSGSRLSRSGSSPRGSRTSKITKPITTVTPQVTTQTTVTHPVTQKTVTPQVTTQTTATTPVTQQITATPSWKPIDIEYKEKKPIAEEYLKSFLGSAEYAKFQAGQEVSIEGKQKLLGFPENVKTIKKSQ